jgi:hypothetical protein
MPSGLPLEPHRASLSVCIWLPTYIPKVVELLAVQMGAFVTGQTTKVVLPPTKATAADSRAHMLAWTGRMRLYQEFK